MSSYYYLQSTYEQPAVQYIQQQPLVQYISSSANLVAYSEPAIATSQVVLGNGEIAWSQVAPLAVAAAPVQQVAVAAAPTTFVRDVVTNVNRHHYHTKRVVTRDNQFNTYVTNHITKVNDIHHYRTENVKGETRVINDYKQTQTVEPARCARAQ